MPKFDAVVVGAGNSGMIAAIRLQLAGKKTLLIEQHNLPGGAASSIRRGRFEFEPSLHELCDVGRPELGGEVREIFDELGIKFDWVYCPDCFHIISKYSDGAPMDCVMPCGIDAFIEKMEYYVPGSADKMRELFEVYEEIRQGSKYTSSCNGHADPAVMKEKYPNMLRTGAYSVNKVFDAMKIPQRCRDILSVYWGYLGVDMDHMAFFHYASMMQRYVRMGAVIPAHTSHQISTHLVEYFRSLGGEVWFNCRANKFLFDGDAICGIDTNMGVIETKMVLPNICPDIIYGTMMPKELVPEREKKLSNARNHQYGCRMMTAYFGLDCTYQELGIKSYSTFLAGSSDSAEQYRNLMGGLKTNTYCILLCPNVANPDASPEGTCYVTLTTIGSPVDWNDCKQEDYYQLKEAYLDNMLSMVKEYTGVDLSGHIEEMEIASPWTFARYLNAPEGAVYGYECRDWDALMARMMMLSTDYPIKGLKPIGASGPRGDGYSAAYITGNLIARLAIKDLNEWEKEEGGNN